MSDEPHKSMEEVITGDGRYPPEAYAFLHEGLAKAVKQTYGDELSEHAQHHVKGQDLCRALRDLAVERWGMLARTVLAKWNIRETMDFGNMVYLLIDYDFMKKTDEDSPEDFRDVYSFADVFSGNGELDPAE